jgi:hypothetical protein
MLFAFLLEYFSRSILSLCAFIQVLLATFIITGEIKEIIDMEKYENNLHDIANNFPLQHYCHFLSRKRNEVDRALSLSSLPFSPSPSSSSPSTSSSSTTSSSSFFFFHYYSPFFLLLLFINDSDCCATKENAFFQIDSCPVNDNDSLFDGDGQGQQATL